MVKSFSVRFICHRWLATAFESTQSVVWDRRKFWFSFPMEIEQGADTWIQYLIEREAIGKLFAIPCIKFSHSVCSLCLLRFIQNCSVFVNSPILCLPYRALANVATIIHDEAPAASACNIWEEGSRKLSTQVIVDSDGKRKLYEAHRLGSAEQARATRKKKNVSVGYLVRVN